MFQEFRTQNRTHTLLVPIWFYVYAIFYVYLFKINSFFPPKALIDASVSYHSYTKIWFQKQYYSY